MIGESVQRYEILEELGQGGMSVVYRGRDTTLNRDVAVKVLHEHLAKKEENRTRFRREAQAIARLQHPNVLDVYDYSSEDDDKSFIVMEYIPGQNLRDFVDEHDHPPPEIAAMIGAVMADALAHAHEHGVIHRDLKPENVMISENGEIKLMDFGIAHVVDAETMTQTGSLLGSPAHMAPEIIDGKDVNRRSDIFSLGTVLYWLSTGDFPFKGDNAPHLLRQVLQTNYREPETVEPRLPRSLARAICRCLSREPDDRFQTVPDLREALADTLEVLGDEVDVHSELSEFFDDPQSYRQQFEAIVVDRLVSLGRTAMEEGRVPAAIAHFNRVLAYDPDNEVVQEELEELNAREITPRQYAIGAAVAAAVAAIVLYVSLAPSTGDDEFDRVETSVFDALSAARNVHSRAAANELGVNWATSTRERSSRLMARSMARRAARLATSTTISVASSFSSDAEGSSQTPVSVSTSPSRSEESEPATPDAGSSADVGVSGDTGATPEPEPPETFTYKFKVLPLAASVYLDGERHSVPDVLNGVSLEKGIHRIKVVSPGCHPYQKRFRVDGPRSDRMSIVLEWKDASIQVLSNRSAVVYLNGNKSRPFQIGANGANARIRVPFGKADSDGRTSKKTLTLEVRARDNLKLVRRQEVKLRPGERTSVNINFPTDR